LVAYIACRYRSVLRVFGFAFVFAAKLVVAFGTAV
jgi:hypothetical protein